MLIAIALFVSFVFYMTTEAYEAVTGNNLMNILTNTK